MDAANQQLQQPLLPPADTHDVTVVVVQSAAQPGGRLHTLAPVTSPATTDSTQAFGKAFADSIVSVKRTSDKASKRTSTSTGASSLDRHNIKWRNQTALMWVWLLSSLVLVMLAPQLVASWALLVAPLSASAMGVVGATVAMRSCMRNRLDETGTLCQRLVDQGRLAAACATAAACINLLAMAAALVVVWTHTAGLSAPDDATLLVLACTCWQHGFVSVAVLHALSSVGQE